MKLLFWMVEDLLQEINIVALTSLIFDSLDHPQKENRPRYTQKE